MYRNLNKTELLEITTLANASEYLYTFYSEHNYFDQNAFFIKNRNLDMIFRSIAGIGM